MKSDVLKGSTISKEEIKRLIEKSPNIVSKIIKSKYPKTFKEIQKIDGEKISEKIFVYVFGKINKCKCCRNETKFRSISKGYNLYCSNKCVVRDTKEQRKSSARKTFKEKYGVTCPSQLDSVKKKIKNHRKNGNYDNVTSKMKKTKLERYGDENYNNIEKNKQSKLERYGDENYNNREKFIETMITTYGDVVTDNQRKRTKERSQSGELGFKSEEFKKWLKENNIENVSQHPEIRNKIEDSRRLFIFQSFQERIKEYVKLNFTIDEFDSVGYYDKKFKFVCKKCGVGFEDYLYSGNIPRCPTCYPKKNYSSIGEYELLYFIQQLVGEDNDVIHKERKLINGELDIVIPSKKIAFEFNGIYWHSDHHGLKDKNYHLNKTMECEKIGYRLIHIWDIDWMHKRNIIENRIKSIFDVTEKIYARNCVVRPITPIQKGLFLNENHLQGNDKSSIRLGLFHNDKLVSVMTFGKHRVALGYTKEIKNSFEMYRFCSKGKIIGGASKLLSHFIKEYTPSSIITYLDYTWGKTNFYPKIGFLEVSTTTPGYYYFNNTKHQKKLFHRFKFRKSELPKLLEKFDPSLSEWENMKNNGYDRIWDCGNIKYVWESD